jgi:aminocarboxymuconate-semialdehyde decarboxylase
MIVDFHNHYYPPEYLEELRRGSHYRVALDDAGNPVLHSPGDYNVVVPGHRDMGYRTRVLDETGVDLQVLSLTCPGTSMEEPARDVELCRIVNDALATVVKAQPERYTALATLPMNDPAAAVEEFARATVDLGLPGVMLFSNANGVPLSDARFWPLYEKADAAGAVFYIHPTYPVGVEAMQEFMLMPMVGFLMDTTLAAASLVYAGVIERFPRIRWVLAHLGGAVPYLAERFDRGFECLPECAARITKPPSAQLRGFWYDTVNFDGNALRLAIEFAGADHIVAGSDYPHMIGSIPKMKASIAALDVSEEERAGIRGRNAARLLGLAVR